MEKEVVVHTPRGILLSYKKEETPWIEEPGGLQSTWSQRVGYNGMTKHIKRNAFESVLTRW